MASPIRRERVAEQIRDELSDIVQNDLRDPRKGWLTILRVAMSPDLNYARVYVSVLGSASEKEAALDVLQRAARFLRAELGRRVRLRQTPELRFELDESIEQGLRIQEILNETEIPPENGGEDEAR